MKLQIKKYLLLIFLFFMVLANFPYMFPSSVKKDELKEFKDKNLLKATGNLNGYLVSDSQEAFELRMALIQNAEKSIDISSYIVHQGVYTDAIFTSLEKAAERGVKIRFFADGKLGKINKYYGSLFSEFSNVEIYQYNRFKILKPWTWQAVFHEKVLLVDQDKVLVGGRNYGDKYYQTTDDIQSLDYDFFVHGSDNEKLFQSIEQHFNALADHPAMTLMKKRKKQVELEQRLYKEYQLSNYLTKTYKLQEVSFIADGLTPYDTKGYIYELLLESFDKAKKEIILQTPYLTSDKRLLQAIEKSNKAGVDVNLLTNSLFSSPNLPAYSHFDAKRDHYLKKGISLYEYQGNGLDSIHGKAYLFDNKTLYLGSLNLDDRSFFINPESMLIIKSSQAADDYMQAFQEHLSSSVALNSAPYEAGLSKAKRPTKLKKVIFKITSLFSRLFSFMI